MAYYKKALAINPDHAGVHANIGAVHDSDDQYYEAIRAYKNSLERDGTQPIVLVNLATTYLKQGRFRLAEIALNKALQMDPHLSMAYERMGHALYRQEKYDQAIDTYERAIRLNPRDAVAYAGLGVVRMRQLLMDPSRTALRDQAVEQWHRSLELEPQQPKLRKLLAKYQPAAVARAPGGR